MTPVERVQLDYFADGLIQRELTTNNSGRWHYRGTVAPYQQQDGCGSALSETNLNSSGISGFSYGDTNRPGFEYDSTTDILTVIGTNNQTAQFTGFRQAAQPVQPLDQTTSDILAAYGCDLPPVNTGDRPTDLPTLTPED
jgi:hypothetical protein